MREPMDAISDPAILKVVVAKAAQVAYTDGIVNNTCGFYIDQDPGPILVVMPTLELAEAWSKDRLAPMLRDTPVLSVKVSDPRSQSENTIRQKVFPGGRITVIGANAPAGLSARPIRIVVGDEIDRWPLSAGMEGDPLALAAKRQQTFWNRKTLIGSTPVKKDTSVIWREYLASDQRRYFVPCHACEHMQTLRWEQVRWDKRGADEEPDPKFGEHKPESAHYVCEHCGSIWNDGERHAAIRNGEWRAARPTQDTAGFHVPGFLSPWLSLEDIVREFLTARNDPQLLQVWVNTVLGEPWESDVEKIESTGLIGRGENYTRDTIPDEAVVLVAGVDVQVNRIEVQVLAFGPNEECWVVAYDTIRGDPQQKGVWDELDEHLRESFHTDIGRELRIRATCIDSGGHTMAQVMAYARVRSAQRIYAIKGADGPRPIWPRQESRSKKNAGKVFIVGVDTAKDAIYGRLMIARPGPGRIHFPIGSPFDQSYFDQLTSEQVTTKRVNGKPRRVWVLPKGRRNEALDTFVYALAARHSLRVRLDRPVRFIPAAPPPPVETVPVEQVPEQPPATPAVPALRHSLFSPSGWVGRRRGWFDRG
jgi:phage terminase large subunit GpA-like protein